MGYNVPGQDTFLLGSMKIVVEYIRLQLKGLFEVNL